MGAKKSPPPPAVPSPSSGTISLLTTLASSGDNWVKLGTLLLIEPVDTWFDQADALMQKWGGISRLQRIIDQLWLA
jgi:hypothetical protein